MADPLSIIAGIVGVAIVAVQSSKALFEIVDDAMQCDEVIRSIARDARTFYAVVFSLNIALKEQNIKDGVSQDDDMVEMIKNLNSPLENCQIVLSKLMVEMQKRLKPNAGGKGVQTILNSVKWALYAKGRIRELQTRLETSKSTLDGALGAVTT